jgi:hypothetical protein
MEEEIMKITRAEAVRRIEKAKGDGHFCSAVVARRTDDKRTGAKKGELRTFNFRGGVRKGVKGVGLPYNPTEHKLIIVWDRKRNTFRAIAIEGIQKLQIEHEKFEVEGD